ncbi:MAG: alpha/beta hydrolase-fold protein [Alphaproteobacteria bacterium]|nr:alpha/beta hydrolase-fold protein [Alphaproteobacteria bacterium]
MVLAPVLGLLLVLLAAGTAGACPGAGSRCEVPGGGYYIRMPAQHSSPVRAVVHAHGYGASGRSVIGNAGLTEPFLQAGLAVVAPDGMRRAGRNGRTWHVLPYVTERHGRRDEVAFIEAVMRDAEHRFGVDRRQSLLSGFSLGGSLVWTVACAAPRMFAAHAPVAGAFWRPPPQECAGPVSLLHTHGWRDRTVPIEGRSIRNGMLRQGDVFDGLETLRRANGCTPARGLVAETAGRFWLRRWDACRAGNLQLALHPGGHEIPQGWHRLVLDWFRAVVSRSATR